MEIHDLIPIGAILVAATILVVVLWRLMRPHVPSPKGESQEVEPKAWAASPELSPDEAEYLDSTHIISPGSRVRGDPPR